MAKISNSKDINTTVMPTTYPPSFMGEGCATYYTDDQNNILYKKNRLKTPFS